MMRIPLLIGGLCLLTACETPTDVELSNSVDPESSTFVPEPPTQVQGSANEAGTLVTVTWQDNSDYESGYSLERRIGAGNWQAVATLEPNTTSYQESLSSRGTSPHTYRVAALGQGSRQSSTAESNLITFNYLVNVTVVGEGSVSERVIQAKSEYAYGSTVELSAIPATGWAFARWDQGLDSDQPIGTLTVTEDVAVTVVFEKQSYPLTITVEGEGVVQERVIQAKTDYEYGTVVELEAISGTNYEFDRWLGDATGTESTTQLTIDEAKDVTAVFETLPFYRDANEVTIKCENAQVGESAIIDGVEYTKRTRDQITPANASTTCTSGVTDMSGLFGGEHEFNEDISHWDVSKVTTMNGMFFENFSFNQPIGSWDVSSVIDMRSMFLNAPLFNQSLESWDVSSVTDMSKMFQQVRAFNQPLSQWDVSKVTNMRSMFDAAESFNQNIRNWDVSSVTDIAYMFQDAKAFNQNIGTWDVSNVKYMNHTFRNTPFNQDIGNWDVSSVTDMAFMFDGAQQFNADLSTWDVSNVFSTQYMFRNAISFNGNINSWNTQSLNDMSAMFEGAIRFNQDIGAWNLSNTVRLKHTFLRASSFNQDISNWNVSNVTNMTDLFRGATDFNQDIGSWDVSSVTEMNDMFNGATAFNQNLSGWCVEQIEIEPSNFASGSSLNEANKPNWGTCGLPREKLIAYYNFDDSGIDLSSNNYNALSIGSTFTNDTPSGRGKALNLSTGITKLPKEIFLFDRTDSFTIAFWFTHNSSGNARIVSTESPEGNFRITRFQSDNKISIQWGDYDTIQLGEPNQWNHIVYTFSGDSNPINRQEQIFLNGSLLPETNEHTRNDLKQEAVRQYNYNFTLGAKASNNNDRWNGLIDELGIWNRVLNESEIQSLYRLGS